VASSYSVRNELKPEAAGIAEAAHRRRHKDTRVGLWNLLLKALTMASLFRAGPCRSWSGSRMYCRRSSVDKSTTNENCERMATSVAKAFGRVVRKHREARQLSQEKLAELAGIHRTYVSSIERGKVRLGLDIAQKVAVGLGVPLHKLVAEAEIGT
jgi:DNA-binding XRE family transcriptional regulator